MVQAKNKVHMKAASSEWYHTKARHVLPIPPSLSTSSSSPSQRFHGSSNVSSHDSSSSPYYYVSQNTSITSSSHTGSRVDNTSTQRSLSLLSTSNRASNSNTPFGSFSTTSRTSHRRSDSTTSATPTATTSSQQRSTEQYPSSSSQTSHRLSSFSDENKYKRAGSSRFPTLGHISTNTSSFGSQQRTQRLQGYQDILESEVSESEVGNTEEDEEETTDIGSSAPVDEASSEEDNDDELVYTSFKDSLKMLRVQESVKRSSKSRSTSPAVSLRSVATDLEEDEEDLPPDEVDDEVPTATEDEEDEEESSSVQSRSLFHSTSVPKSPVRVKVKVERSVPDYDDRVKVTVSMEEEETEASEDEDASEDEYSNHTEETVRFHRGERTEGESYEDESEEESTAEGSASGQMESGSLSEDEEEDEAEIRALIDKTDPIRMLSQSPFRTVSSLGDLPPGAPRTGGLQLRSKTIHEIHESENISSETKKSELPNTHSVSSNGSRGAALPPGILSLPVAPPTASSHSETSSSRSQSARSSLIGRATATHKMYSVGGKLRSLSARRPLLPSPLRPIPSQIQSLSIESSTPSISSKTTLSDFSAKVGDLLFPPLPPSPTLSKFSGLALPSERMSMLSTARTRSLSARLLSSARKRQDTYTVLRQLSLGDVNKLPEDILGLPPSAAPSSPSTFSVTSTSLIAKHHPLRRNLTYIVFPTTSESGSGESTSKDGEDGQSEISSGQIRLRQFETVSSSASTGHTGSGSASLSEIVTSALGASKVAFSNQVIEHSLSSSQKTTSVTSDQSGSTQQRPISAASSASEDASDASTDDEEKQNQKRKLKLTQEQLLNKSYFTFAEIAQETVAEPDDDKGGERLKRFAKKAIRKQIKREKRQQRDVPRDPHDNLFGPGAEEEEEEESEEESSELTEEDESSKLKARRKSQIGIPLASVSESLVAAAKGEEVKRKVERTASSLKLDQLLGAGNSLDTLDDHDAGWAEVDQERLATEAQLAEEALGSPLLSRLNSAASGYRAMPPTRCSSRDKIARTRHPSDEESDEDLEKEKDLLIEEWKKTGEMGPPPDAKSLASSKKSSAKFYGGHALNRTDSYADGLDINDLDGSDQDDRIRGGIDLTKELTHEEKKLKVVWEEFNRDDRDAGATADYDFSSLLDDMVTDVHNYKPRAQGDVFSSSHPNSQEHSQSLHVSNSSNSNSNSSSEQAKGQEGRKYQIMSELVSLLSHNLRLVSTETLEDHMASLITLISQILKKVRKNKCDDDYPTQIACLSSIRVLCDRLQEMHNSQNLKYADLSWLFRILCKYSSDTDSKIRPEASFCLARLVKVAGPALVVRPIYFILVMESESGGTEGKAATGAKTKAAAIDTLTYALLTFPKEDFHNLEEIAGWVCLSLLNDERRIRQSALECLAVISQHLGGRDKCIPLFHTLFLKEELDHFSRSPSPESGRTGKTGKSSKSKKSGGGGAMPLSVHGTVRLLTGPGFPIAQPIDAVISRLEKDVLPVPSTKGLIEYAVNVPTGKDLVLLMTHMLEKDDDAWDFSSSSESAESGSIQSKRSSASSLGMSDIDWTGDGPSKSDKTDESQLISPDVAYILLGKGRVNKQEVVLLDTYKKEIIPEIIEMLNKKNRQGRGGRNRKRWAKQGKKRRRRKGQQKKQGILDDDVGALSRNMSVEDDTLHADVVGGTDDEVYNDNSPVAVVVDPPPEEART